MRKAYRVVLTLEAEKMWASIADRRIQGKLRDKMRELGHDPEIQGKPLLDDLAGYRSLRAVGQRYRIIYRVDRNERVVQVVAVGLRKAGNHSDVYALAKKLLRLKLIEPRSLR